MRNLSLTIFGTLFLALFAFGCGGIAEDTNDSAEIQFGEQSINEPMSEDWEEELTESEYGRWVCSGRWLNANLCSATFKGYKHCYKNTRLCGNRYCRCYKP